MLLRAYESADCPALLRLFYDTVHAVCAADYTAEQLDAWATGREDAAAWDRSLRAHRTLVAVLAGEIAGFADLDTAAGYLDRLYVHRAYQRRGVATALCDALEPLAAGRTVTTHVLGLLLVLRAQQVERGGVLLTNFVMEKPLPPGHDSAQGRP